MLGKLIKYDLRYGMRTLLVACGTVFVYIAVFPRVVAYMERNRQFTYSSAVSFINGILMFGIIGLTVTAVILLIQLFNKGLYGDEGYLMHTLPVTPWALVGSKIITTVIWILAAALALLLGAFIGLKDFPADFITGLTENFYEIITIIAYFLSSLISGITTVYLCIALARLWVQRGVLPLAFVFYWLINSVISSVIQAVFYQFGTSAMVAGFLGVLMPFAFIGNYDSWIALLWVVTGYNLLWAGGLYALTVLCMGRRIKLR